MFDVWHAEQEIHVFILFCTFILFTIYLFSDAAEFPQPLQKAGVRQVTHFFRKE
jgi:hypothetical protein